MAITQVQVNTLLTDMGYAAHFQQHFAEREYDITYRRINGRIQATSFLDMARKYKILTKYAEADYPRWEIALRNEHSNQEELLVPCLRILDWGEVYERNVREVLDLYEAGNLKGYLAQMRRVLGTTETLKNEADNLLFSAMQHPRSILG